MNEPHTANGDTFVTSDLAGAAARHVEREYGDEPVALFLIAAAGDQPPYLTAHRHTLGRDGRRGRVDIGEAGHLIVELLGERLGSEVVHVVGRTKLPERGTTLRVAQGSVEVSAAVGTAPGTHQPHPRLNV
jgi:neutral ceramidase